MNGREEGVGLGPWAVGRGVGLAAGIALAVLGWGCKSGEDDGTIHAYR